ncbi:hypothetical protein BJ742DRAFT_786812 [Cladochytrium replicatum]|nr:hypothetical protein BJ742DRAFT_786812 [Cladochytrium replicatum]
MTIRGAIAAGISSGTFWTIGDTISQFAVERRSFFTTRKPESAKDHDNGTGAQVPKTSKSSATFEAPNSPPPPSNSLSESKRSLSSNAFSSVTPPPGASVSLSQSSQSSQSHEPNSATTPGANQQVLKQPEQLNQVDGGIRPWDPYRTLRLALFGTTINGPYYYYAFRIIDRVVGTSASVRSVVIKAISSQTFFSPPYLATFLAYTGYFEGANPVERVQSRFVELYTSSWMIWPFVNVLNFKYMKPGVPRILFMNVLGVAWNVYMSWVSQRDAIAGQNGLGPPSSSPPKSVVV